MPLLLSGIAAFVLAMPAAQAEEPAKPPAKRQELSTGRDAGRATPRDARPAPGMWPGDVTTKHAISVGGQSIAFSATAGYITLRNATTREPLADIAYIAFARNGTDPARRPVTFAFNGGPGYASAWLNLGAMGPWRLPMNGEGVFPSAAPALSDNQESWLSFTDLVFIDPAGTGYGRIRGKGVTDTLWSVDGDIDSLATVIRRWSEQNGRTASPKYLAGESYGGFRVPKIAHKLQTDQGVGVDGLIMISPVLDFSTRRMNGPLQRVAELPSMAAVAMSRGKAITRADLRPVEDYARGQFVVDLLKGRSDSAAVARLSSRVSALTGLDRSFVEKRAGRITASAFAREFYRASGKVASAYDGLVTGLDPDRYSSSNDAEDQLRLGLHAPLVQAMAGLYRERLQWIYPEGRYMFQNKQAGRSWKWGRRPAQAVDDLASVVALDPNLKAFVVHGLTDLVTPYFDTQMVLDRMTPIGNGKRIRLQVYPGGHMFYSREESRKAFRDDVRAMMDAQDKKD
ncbi:MAG: S10 family peptidase [Beijerinckiaceae bacterium]